MRKPLTFILPLLALACLAADRANAQEALVPPPCPEVVRKVVHPTTETVKREEVCYDAKEYDYAKAHTFCAHLWNKICPCAASTGCEETCPSCVRCGKARVRKVLIKKITVEEVEKPKCVVERVVQTAPAGCDSAPGKARPELLAAPKAEDPPAPSPH